MPMNPLKKEAESLADVFAFMALLLRYPDSSFFDAELLDSLEALLVSLSLPQKQQDIATWRARTADPLTDAQIEYTRLFINGVPRVVAPPYAACHQGDGTIQDKTTETIRDFYREQGFDLTFETEPADHIQFQLEFLACLFRAEKYAVAEQFITTLFLPWFTTFQPKVFANTDHPLYRVALQLISFFTKEEQ
jgi:TorA maturation chaperone TorD